MSVNESVLCWGRHCPRRGAAEPVPDCLSPVRTVARRVQLLGACEALFLALLFGAGSLAFAQANDPDGYGDGYQSGAYGRVRSADQGGTILRADGEGSESDRATVNAPLFPGDLLRTDAGQRVEVQLAGGSMVRIDSESELVFQSLPNPSAKFQDNTILVLRSGVIRVTSRLGENEEFRIDTPDAAVYLNGEGEFRVAAGDRNGTRVASLRGVAEVVGNDASVLVRGGMGTLVTSGSAPSDAACLQRADVGRIRPLVRIARRRVPRERSLRRSRCAGGRSRRGPSVLRRALDAGPVGRGRRLRRRVVSDRRVRRLAPVLRRVLVVRPRRLLLGLERALGLGALPLRLLAMDRLASLVLGARARLRRRVGLVVLGIVQRRLGAARLLGPPRMVGWTALRGLLRSALLDVRELRPHSVAGT